MITKATAVFHHYFAVMADMNSDCTLLFQYCHGCIHRGDRMTGEIVFKGETQRKELKWYFTKCYKPRAADRIINLTGHIIHLPN